ncbi:MAG: hypothetical protein ACLTQG_30800 [Hungatella sp.]|uniref:hypothetical protein n=1 Tax=Hungatella sp. TaxID=2613924 RepID=UPI0039967DCE
MSSLSIHRDAWFRTEACYRADSLEGEFTGRDVLRDDLNYCGQGVAQGGIVDTPEGDWYGILFQDRGAVGRIPVVVPVTWVDDFPVFGVAGRVPEELEIKSTRPDHRYAPLFVSDDFCYEPNQDGKAVLKKWEFNHEPDDSLWSVTERLGAFRIRTGRLAHKLEEAVNYTDSAPGIPRLRDHGDLGRKLFKSGRLCRSLRTAGLLWPDCHDP